MTKMEDKIAWLKPREWQVIFDSLDLTRRDIEAEMQEHAGTDYAHTCQTSIKIVSAIEQKLLGQLGDIGEEAKNEMQKH